MKRSHVLSIPVLVMAIALPALAGSDDRCEKGTQECLDHMAMTLKDKGWVGIELDRSEAGQLSIERVVDDSPAAAAGFEKGDVLVALDGVAFGADNHAQMKAKWHEMVPGKTVRYTVMRHGKKKSLDVTLASPTDLVMASWVGAHMLEHAAERAPQQQAKN